MSTLAEVILIILAILVVITLIMHWSERGMCKRTAQRPIYMAIPMRLLNYLLFGIPGLIANMALLGEYEFVPLKK